MRKVLCIAKIKDKMGELAKNPLIFLLTSALIGILSGVINGFLGSGGGILLIFGMGALLPHQKTKDRFATAVISILPMSAVSAYIYCREGNISLFPYSHYFSAALF